MSLLLLSKSFCVDYYLKLINEDETYMPIVLTHKTKVEPSKYSWYKCVEKDFIENINQNSSYSFEIDEARGTNTLKIFYVGSNQLDHYILKLKTPREETDSIDEIIYTIGFLKSFHMDAVDWLKHSNITCFINGVIPIGLNLDHMTFLTEKIQKSIYLEINYGSSPYETTNQMNIEQKRKRRGRDKIDKENSFDRFVYEIKINTPSIIVYNEDNKTTKSMISCELFILDFEDTVYKKVINLKTIVLSNSSLRSVSSRFKTLFALLMIFLNYKINL